VETGGGSWIDFLDMGNESDRRKVYDLLFENLRLEEQNFLLKAILAMAVFALCITYWPW
jgi:hypothetical protein